MRFGVEADFTLLDAVVLFFCLLAYLVSKVKYVSVGDEVCVRERHHDEGSSDGKGGRRRNGPA